MTVLPSAWVMAEAVRSWQSLGGPWALLGGSQWNQPATLASASLGGVWLTSFLLVAVNTAIAGVLLGRGVSVRIFALGVAFAGAGVGPAWFVLGPAPPVGSTVRVALVQPGDIDDSARRQAAGLALTATLAGERADLVVWGESSVGVDLASHPETAKNLAQLSRRVGADLLVNVDAPAATGGIYKSSVLIGPNGAGGRLPESPAGPLWRVRAIAPAARLGNRPHQGGSRGPAARQRAGGTARRHAHHRTVDQRRSDLLRPPPPGGATRRPDAGVPELHLLLPGELGAAAIGQPGRDSRSSRWAARRCTPGCPATARPSTRGAANSPGAHPHTAARLWWMYRSDRSPPSTSGRGIEFWRWPFRSSQVPASWRRYGPAANRTDDLIRCPPWVCRGLPSLRKAQVVDEPVAGQHSDLLERAGFFE